VRQFAFLRSFSTINVISPSYAYYPRGPGAGEYRRAVNRRRLDRSGQAFNQPVSRSWCRGPLISAEVGTWRGYLLFADIFWLKDESLEDSANLPDPDVIAAEIAEDLQAELDQFIVIAADLRK